VFAEFLCGSLIINWPGLAYFSAASCHQIWKKGQGNRLLAPFRPVSYPYFISLIALVVVRPARLIYGAFMGTLQTY